jgi:hypothetical protein
MDDLIPALRAFKSFFTLKHITVVVFAALCLVLICTPHQDNEPFAQTCSEASCLFPRPNVVTISEVRIEEVGQENWSFDLSGDGWESREPSNPSIKVIRRNLSQECMVLLIKEQTDLQYADYIVEAIRGFMSGGDRVNTIKQVMLNQQKFVLMEGNVAESDVLLSWNTTKDGFGYSFNCFYAPNVDAGSAQYDLCVEMFESLQIK